MTLMIGYENGDRHASAARGVVIARSGLHCDHAPPDNDDQRNYNATPYLQGNRAQDSGSRFTKVVKRAAVRVNRIVIDSDALTDCWLFIFWAMPAAVGYIVYAECVAVPIMVVWFVSENCSPRSLLTLGDCSVDSPLID